MSVEIFAWEAYEPLQIAYQRDEHGAQFDSIRIDDKPIPLTLINPDLVSHARWIVEDIDACLKLFDK